MAKTNFTKAENALNNEMIKTTVRQVNSMADKKNPNEIESTNKLIALLKFELAWLEKQDKNLLKNQGISKSEIKAFIQKKEALTKEDLDKLLIIKEKIEVFKKEINKKSAKTDDELVNKERNKHINKRFNTNDNWLPLQ